MVRAWRALLAFGALPALLLACPLDGAEGDAGPGASDAGGGATDAAGESDAARATTICSDNQNHLEDHYCWIMLRACEEGGLTTYYWVDCELDTSPQSCECKLGVTSGERDATVVGSFEPQADLCTMGSDRVADINAGCGWALVSQ